MFTDSNFNANVGLSFYDECLYKLLNFEWRKLGEKVSLKVTKIVSSITNSIDYRTASTSLISSMPLFAATSS